MIRYERHQGGQSVELSSDNQDATRSIELGIAMPDIENEWPEDNDDKPLEYYGPNQLINTQRLFGKQAIMDVSKTNLHHTLFNRLTWSKYPMPRRLRGHHGTHIRLPIYVHDELHAVCSSISIPTIGVAKFALSRLGSQPHTYQSLDRIKDLAESIREIDGGQQIANGLTEQLPFLTEGTNLLKRKVL